MPCEVSDELRGWRWSEYPLAPAYPFKLTVSDIAGGFCETGRDVYLRYVLRERGRANERVEMGGFIHRVVAEALRAVKSILYTEGLVTGEELRARMEEWGRRALRQLLGDASPRLAVSAFNALWSRAINVYASALDRVRSRSPYLSVDGAVSLIAPASAEYPLDGSLIGLSSSIRVDELLPPAIIVEVKTRGYRQVYDVGLAAYALAFESQYEVPVNYALMVLVRFNRDYSDFTVYERPTLISDGLRQSFIERRDQLAKIVEEGIDPGMPSRCDPDCPYLHVCRGE
ncbi:type I-A CRISPR-associated protein Cas4/Csa1 [Candidatus Geothermarchaeota archaeon ex4572_27]|nr:MAG: type I-A CRISPR-associated protein Cas4/Csa1 [Candidatus Geothermarchaeota archaeon ex4572_27]